MTAVDLERPVEWRQSTHVLFTSNGKGHGDDVEWTVVVRLGGGGRITREVRMGHDRWIAESREWCPELTLWPTWSPDEEKAGESPLQSVHDYWSASDDRLRDSAKWMAAVLGAAVAALVGTSPLAGMRDHRPAGAAVAVGVAGLVLLGFTLALVLRVMRPHAVSYTEVQTSDQGTRWWPFGSSKGSLRRWKRQVESQQDLYLPCGVKCLTSLRQSMIIEEVTLIALAHAAADGGSGEVCGKIRQAQAARTARLKELRDAAARIATIGEFYRVRFRSTCSTYYGLLCGLGGTAAVVAAFTWPHA
jgi:hypothetical protein